MTIRNNWYVITGAPCSGKTTILSLLKEKGYSILEEAARVYIDKELAKGHTLQEIRKNEFNFQKKILQMKINSEKKIPKNKLIFLERGIPDSIAYYKLCGINKDNFLEQQSKKCFYKKIFLFELLDYEKDYARTEDNKQAVFLEKLLAQSYHDLGMAIVKIPKMPIEKRLQKVLSYL